jgi:hypothetical protein
MTHRQGQPATVQQTCAEAHKGHMARELTKLEAKVLKRRIRKQDPCAALGPAMVDQQAGTPLFHWVCALTHLAQWKK